MSIPAIKTCNKCQTVMSECFLYNGQWLCDSNVCLQEEIEKDSGKDIYDEEVLDRYRQDVALGMNIAPSVYTKYSGSLSDSFTDENGVDTTNSINEGYDSTNYFYHPSGFDISTINSYSEDNQNDEQNLYTGNVEIVGNSLTVTDANTVSSIKYYLRKTGTITGNAYAKIYAVTGTVGTTGVPTGSALATSAAYDVSALTTSYQLIEFAFSSSYSMAAGDYCITLEYQGGSVENSLDIGRDSTTPTFSGNGFFGDDVDNPIYTALTYDFIFYLYGYINANKNMTLISTENTATEKPYTSTLTIHKEDVDTITTNVDLKGWVTRDGGTNWMQADLYSSNDDSDGYDVLIGIADLSTQNHDTDIRWKLTTHNNKDVKIHQVELKWGR